MLGLHTAERGILGASMTPHKVVLTYKRKRSSFHPDSVHVKRENLSSESSEKVNSIRSNQKFEYGSAVYNELQDGDDEVYTLNFFFLINR